MRHLWRVGMLAAVLLGSYLVLPAAAQVDVNTRLRDFLAGTFTGTLTVTGPILEADGTAGLPAYSFASEPTLGFWRSAAGIVTLQGTLATTGQISIAGAQNLNFTGRGYFYTPANGAFNLANTALTIGSQLKVDALPTIASGFGTAPSIEAGGTALNFTVNVGTGGAATTGTVNLNGTAFPSRPGCTLSQSAGTALTTYTSTTTTVTLSTGTAWPASTLVTAHCISPK